MALGRVGILLGIEVSRLACNNADWYRLLDFCGVTDTLIADLWVERQPQPHTHNATDYRYARMRFISEAKQWLSFLGRLRTIEAPRGPYTHLIDEFVDHTVREKGLSQHTVRIRRWYLEQFLDRFWQQHRPLRRLVGWYVCQHDEVLPHAAFEGQTPDEMYFGHGEHVPERLARQRQEARQSRLERNRQVVCSRCPHTGHEELAA